MYTVYTMAGLLALPNDVIELIGKHFVTSSSLYVFRRWCRVTTTCKRLWIMQLPKSSFEWSVDLNDGMDGDFSCPLQP